MKINSLLISFRTTPPIRHSATMLRGFISNIFPHEVIFHQHEGDGFLYIYPRIQYKVIEGSAFILGIDEGACVMGNELDTLRYLNLGNIVYEVKSREKWEKEVDFGYNKEPHSYHFLTPWLALNERNYEKYQRYGTWAKRKELLEKILVGNLLSMSKGLGYTVTEPIRAEIHNLKEVRTSLKGTPMLGFLGTFSVNFEIPDYWGIGKSVSRGFGTVKRI